MTSTNHKFLSSSFSLFLSHVFDTFAQVWFQNRRSKERRMKQVNSMSTRRGFFRTTRSRNSVRGARHAPGADEDPQTMLPNGQTNSFTFFSGKQKSATTSSTSNFEPT